MSRIPDDVIAHIKRSTDLIPLIKTKGIKLRRHGKVYKGCCPFHEEKTPSFTVTPAENLWHCFGCDAGGDVIRFVELMDKVSFPEAVKRLNGVGTSAVTKKPPSLTAKPPAVNPA